jgi:PPOX class probable F420-dependent enzyme
MERVSVPAEVESRLRREAIAWLTTVREDGQPQPVPVWFSWDGEQFVVFSRPGTQKLRNIAVNPKVSLHLNSDERGGQVVRFDGLAEIVPDGQPATAYPAMIEKYREGIRSLGMTPESFARSYSVQIRVRPMRLMSW